ncbi:hypothetical protein A3C95_00105 [Candidatus Kaiserbacteria bacterium RIFCSPHIGHO2_02_FULL_56_30]|uniref:Uncharacterized protein n=1 Tax=Candidatus Kaiserbacteria bacterium RIFCSPHIGHO2_02_FULL_56_30 TaxID=1798499 RepID=A0A1F6E1Z9_9BACT|nr:MAG: hypothetical protein A3C95_00105 [Candidatus Kaiserbacteria bacterium RIFCSPHIGHO2_02_FULL_56_30]
MEVLPPRTGAAAQAAARQVPREREKRAVKGMALTLMAAAAAAVTVVRQRQELMEQATATAVKEATALQGQVGAQEDLRTQTRETRVPWAAAVAVVQAPARFLVRLLQAARAAATRRLTLRTARAAEEGAVLARPRTSVGTAAPVALMAAEVVVVEREEAQAAPVARVGRASSSSPILRRVQD